jgi:hypothetical protein
MSHPAREQHSRVISSGIFTPTPCTAQACCILSHAIQTGSHLGPLHWLYPQPDTLTLRSAHTQLVLSCHLSSALKVDTLPFLVPFTGLPCSSPAYDFSSPLQPRTPFPSQVRHLEPRFLFETPGHGLGFGKLEFKTRLHHFTAVYCGATDLTSLSLTFLI